MKKINKYLLKICERTYIFLSPINPLKRPIFLIGYSIKFHISSYTFSIIKMKILKLNFNPNTKEHEVISYSGKKNKMKLLAVTLEFMFLHKFKRRINVY